ncbi:MAG TPA: ribose-phosphate pyrophosphokinase [Pyrinomonadaceae bacterium]
MPGKGDGDFLIFAGTASADLAASIARHFGVGLGASSVDHFPDGEVSVKLDEPVRGREVFIVQATSPPVNDHLVELLAFADACRRASAKGITAIVPYFGYARADKRHGRRESISASMVADLLQAVGITHVVTVDVHTQQLEGFFRIPVDSLTAVPILVDALRDRLQKGAVVVSPDAGRVRMATEFAHRLQTSVVVLHKRRESGTETKVTHLVGEVRGRACLIIDDMISTGGTMAESIEALLNADASPEIIVAATHGLLLDGAREHLSHKSVRKVFVTDTVASIEKDWPQLQIISVAPLIAGAIQRFMTDGSLSDLC